MSVLEIESFSLEGLSILLYFVALYAAVHPDSYSLKNNCFARQLNIKFHFATFK